MAYFSDLLPLIMAQQQFQPPGGPVMRPLPKAQTNVTATPNPAVKLPPDYATTMGNLANLFSEMPLRQAQANQAGMQSQFLKTQIDAMPQQDAMIKAIIARAMGGGQPIPINGNAQQGANAGNAPQQAGGGEVGSPAPNADTSGSGPVGDGGIGAAQLHGFLTDNGATPNEAAMLTSAANSESSFQPDTPHDGGVGYGLFGHNGDRLAGMRQFAGVGQNDPVPWQKQALFALNELHGSESKAGDMVNAATTPDQLTDAQLAFERPNLNIAGGNRAQRLASTREYMANPPGAKPTQVAQADTGMATDATPVSQSAWSALGGEGAPPAAPAAAPSPTGLPPRIGLDGNGPNAKLINQDTGQPLNLNTPAPAAPAPTATPFTNAPPITGVGAPAPGPQARPQMAQVPQAPPSAPMPLMPGGGATFGTGLDPLALGALGAFSEAHRLPNVAAPLAQAYYNSPQYKQQIAEAEKQVALKYAGPMTDATKRVDLQYAQPLAAAGAAGTFPYQQALERSKFIPSRAGEGIYDPLQQQEVFQTPTIQQVVNPDGSKSFAYVQPGMNGGAPSVAMTGAKADLSPQAKSAGEASGVASVQANPNAFNVPPPQGNGPGFDKPQPMADGSVIPPVNAAAPIVGGAKSVEDQQHDWNDRTKEWGEQQSALQTAIQRTQMVGKAMQSYQTGAFANELSEVRAGLKSVGVTLPDSIAGDPAQAQIILKNAFRATLDTLQTAHLSRATQMEVKLSLENFANPNLQPEANRAILGQTLGQLQWEQAKIQGWAPAKANGWRDPNDYERAWVQRPENDLQGFVNKAEQQIGPLKGASNSGTPNAAPTATATGPNGHKIGLVGNQWIDLVTRQPVQ